MDFDKMCRSCLNCADNMASIFTKSGSNKNLSRILSTCVDLKVSSNDGLPGQMCQPCVSKLHLLYNFRIQCRKSNNFLKNCIALKYVSVSPQKDADDSVNHQSTNGSLHLEFSYGEDNEVSQSISDVKFDIKNEISDDEIPLANIINKQRNLELLKEKKLTKKRKRKSSLTNNDTDGFTSSSEAESTNNSEKLKLLSDPNEQLTGNNFNEIPKKNEFLCNICCEVATTKEDLKIHKSIHYTYMCKICQLKLQNIQEFRKHYCEHVPKKIETNCDDDQLKLDKITHLRSLKASCIRVLICHICKKEFKYTRSLKYHLRSHTGEKPALCTWCGKSFREHRGLLNHVRAVHTGEKRFKCSFCPKAFTVSGKKRQHERVHTGEKPYQCDVCCRLFAVRTTLNAHRRRHTGENKFRCTVQGCGQGFYAFSTYQRHMWAHKGERPYPCQNCGKTYLSTQNLRSHIKAAHTKLRDEVCHICGKGFTEKSVLNRHLRKIHNYEPNYNKPIPVFGSPSDNPAVPSSSTLSNMSLT